MLLMKGCCINVYLYRREFDGVEQVSWLSMYHMLEDQHRGELQAQYAEHQRMINDMQRHLEGELLNQQHSMQQKLASHREVQTFF